MGTARFSAPVYPLRGRDDLRRFAGPGCVRAVSRMGKVTRNSGGVHYPGPIGGAIRGAIYHRTWYRRLPSGVANLGDVLVMALGNPGIVASDTNDRMLESCSRLYSHARVSGYLARR